MKKITLATLKKFIRENEGKLKIKINSNFDGMSDMVVSVQDNFRDVQKTEKFEKNTLGISGLWLVGSSRDSITKYDNEEFEGFSIYNCCGSQILAISKEK